MKIVKALVDTETPDPLSMVVSEDVRKVLTGAIHQLPEKERMALDALLLRRAHDEGNRDPAQSNRIPSVPDSLQAALTLKARLQTIL